MCESDVSVGTHRFSLFVAVVVIVVATHMENVNIARIMCQTIDVPYVFAIEEFMFH